MGHREALATEITKIVRVWADGRLYYCVPKVDGDGALTLRFNITPHQPADDDPDFQLACRTDDEIRAVLNTNTHIEAGV